MTYRDELKIPLRTAWSVQTRMELKTSRGNIQFLRDGNRHDLFKQKKYFRVMRAHGESRASDNLRTMSSKQIYNQSLIWSVVDVKRQSHILSQNTYVLNSQDVKAASSIWSCTDLRQKIYP